MHHAHQAGIVHRDLKPANVLLQRLATDHGPAAGNDATLPATDHWPPTLVPKITDFGLAKRLGDAAQTLSGATMTGKETGEISTSNRVGHDPAIPRGGKPGLSPRRGATG